MEYTVTIEIPRGSNRRIHMSHDKSGFIDLGSIKDQIPVNEGIMPCHYGYINQTLNEDDGDEIDVIILSKRSYNTGDKVDIEILGMITRQDGDNKIIARDNSETDSVFDKLSETDRVLILDYFGYKSPITSIDTKAEALEYCKQRSKVAVWE